MDRRAGGIQNETERQTEKQSLFEVSCVFSIEQDKHTPPDTLDNCGRDNRQRDSRQRDNRQKDNRSKDNRSKDQLAAGNTVAWCE